MRWGSRSVELQFRFNDFVAELGSCCSGKYSALEVPLENPAARYTVLFVNSDLTKLISVDIIDDKVCALEQSSFH